jgi:predicted nuclease of restriction endonuclease-like RecB superfamily
MLPTNLVRVKFARNRVTPQYLDASVESWPDVAAQMLEVFRGKDGISRGELAEEIEDAIGNHPGQLVHQGLAKLLEDRCEFEVVSGHPPEELREQVFRLAAEQRAGGTFNREAILQTVAQALHTIPAAVEQGLFADLKSEQRLVKFDDTTVNRLIERYNVALAQAILMRSTSVEVSIRNEPPARFRQLFRASKFHRLVMEVEQVARGTTILRLDGPLSLFSATQKYGLQLALFLPWILQCKDLELRADVLWGAKRKPKSFVITSADGLVSHLPDYASYTPPELTMFVELFRKRNPDWTIDEETEVIPLGKGIWVPDFRLRYNVTGKTIYVEVLGYWRRSSAEKHLANLRKHATAPFILAVSEQLKIDEEELEGLPATIHRFRQMPLPDEIARIAADIVAGS